ncbi:hypothetical protein KGP36_02740 [Patescibacteria group bacterium]|nr:hypothetical protein [Patescibacteria group bacterium]
MRIQTTESVRRFNAQTELVDIALEYAADEITDPGRLFALLCLAGHAELKRTFEESMRQVCMMGTGWPDARPTAPDPSHSPHIVSEGSTKSPNLREELIQAWDTCRSVADRLQDVMNDIETAQQSLGNRELCLRDAIKSMPEEPIPHWKSFQEMARQRDEMRTTLKQCRQALSVALCGTPSEHYFAHVKEIFKTTDRKTIEDNLAANTKDIKRLAQAALHRINSIIPASEV